MPLKMLMSIISGNKSNLFFEQKIRFFTQYKSKRQYLVGVSRPNCKPGPAIQQE
jgi:hypothetical protein